MLKGITLHSILLNIILCFMQGVIRKRQIENKFLILVTVKILQRKWKGIKFEEKDLDKFDYFVLVSEEGTSTKITDFNLHHVFIKISI